MRAGAENGVARTVYLLDAQSGAEIATLVHPDPVGLGQFGFDVAIDSGVVAVSAMRRSMPDGSTGGPAVYLFDAATGAPLRRIDAPDGLDYDWSFATSIALAGERLAVSVFPLDGPVFVELYSVPTGERLRALPVPTTISNASAHSIAMHGSMLVVGEAGFDGAQGRAVFVDLDRDMFVSMQRRQSGPFNDFGHAVDLSREGIVVGSPGANLGGNGVGTVEYFVNPRARADLAEPFGVLDLSDLTAFISAFLDEDPAADIDRSGVVFDLVDLNQFVAMFLGQTPP